MGGPIMHITSDEINRLIYSYFKDSGFEHSAYALAKESHLEDSPCFAKHVARGELVELLSKSLLYTEVESHFRGGELAANCKTAFSLLEPHRCSTEPPTTGAFDYSTVAPVIYSAPAPPPDAKPNATPVVPEPSSKRKASLPPMTENPVEKRPRTDPSDANANANGTPADQSKDKPKQADPQPPPKSAPVPAAVPSESKKLMSRPAQRKQGPGDNLTNPEAIRVLDGHTSEVFVCAWNPKKHNLLATGSKDAVVKLWNVPDPPSPFSFAPQPGEPITSKFSTHDAADLTCLSWNPQGTLLAIASYDKTLRLCDTSGKIVYKTSDHQGPVFTARFSPSGRWLVTASLDNTARVWDIPNRRIHRVYKVHKDCCLDVDWINDTLFASCGADRNVYVLSVDDPNPLKTFKGHKDEINQIKANPSGTKLASCSDDRETRIWDLENISNSDSADLIPGLGGFGSNDSAPVILQGHRGSVSTIAWFNHPRTQTELIATGSFDGTVRIWDPVSGRCDKVMSEHKRPIYALSVSPNNLWMASGGGDGWLHVYTLKDFEKIWSWFAGVDKPGVFEIDWQSHDHGEGREVDRIAMALECWQVGVVDIRRVPAVWETRNR